MSTVKQIALQLRSLGIFLMCSLFAMVTYGQTTFTESAAAYNLNVGGTKDGGHAWADYDLDGDFDLVINTNGRGYLLRNDGGSFSDQTAALAPDFLGGTLERTALFVDFNNDGYPDVFRNKHNDLRIYLQDPATNRFGDGIGGTAPSQRFTSLTDGMNTEGAGALDYDGDGDLDIFVDNHNYGIDILQNDGNGFFTHVTRKADSPLPPYNVGNPATWPLGLVQDATDGDYGSATDFNDDGWVDIVVRNRDQVDLFTNLGGSFQNGVDIDQA
ncbi:MAG: VCBS repeat-containing protein, partial [Eudoraea sp.]|nr:VCBS repeat-containing protein [Eudoraea sp.]NNK29328.1 VCBS repeat-containing protein [Flavobacteriaceae bacterium]